MKSGQKLELTWVGKDERPRLEPRVLVEDPAKSYPPSPEGLRRAGGDPTRPDDRPVGREAENMLIFGDNLLALKALEQDFAGKIKSICLDPP